MLAILIPVSMVSLEVSAETVGVLDNVNVLGVTRIESDLEYLPLAAKWGRVATSNIVSVVDGVTNIVETMDDKPIYIADLVATSTLLEGDELYAYNHDQGRYNVFRLQFTGDDMATWKSVDMVSITTNGQSEVVSQSATETEQGWGYGFWLHRPGITNRTNKTVYLIGQVRVGAIDVWVDGDSTGERRVHSLIGSPLANDIHLNGSEIDWNDGPKEGDEIRVPKADGVQDTVVYENGRWVHHYKVAKKIGTKVIYQDKTDIDPVIPRGRAAWYARQPGLPGFIITWQPE